MTRIEIRYEPEGYVWVLVSMDRDLCRSTRAFDRQDDAIINVGVVGEIFAEGVRIVRHGELPA